MRRSVRSFHRCCFQSGVIMNNEKTDLLQRQREIIAQRDHLRRIEAACGCPWVDAGKILSAHGGDVEAAVAAGGYPEGWDQGLREWLKRLEKDPGARAILAGMLF